MTRIYYYFNLETGEVIIPNYASFVIPKGETPSGVITRILRAFGIDVTPVETRVAGHDEEGNEEYRVTIFEISL